jgi:hypothetical protein
VCWSWGFEKVLQKEVLGQFSEYWCDQNVVLGFEKVSQKDVLR